MTGPAPRRTAATLPIATPLDLLDRLATRQARGEIRLGPDGQRSFEVHRSLSGSTRTAAVAPFVVFLEAREAGHLAVIDEAGPAWGLSRAGRIALRQARSAGREAQAASGTATAQAAIPPSMPAIDPAESPLAWLRRRRDKSGQPLITSVQFDAGERLRADLHFAGMTPRVTVNWDATGGSANRGGGGLGVELRDSVAAAQQRVRRAMAAIGGISAGVLIDVCGHLQGLERIERDRGWPARSGKVALQIALSQLATHYGLPGADPAPRPNAVRVRHWAMPGYRPAADPVPE